MKKIFIIFAALALFILGCGSDSTEENDTSDTTDPQEETADTSADSETPDASEQAEEQEDSDTNDAAEGGKKILVAYFSRTENTKPLAEYAAEILGADLFRIEAAEPYTADDINYNNSGCRAQREQQDEASRPAIKAAVSAMEQYDVIVIAHPIWYGIAPRIISTFLESYDFSGKKLVTFCTSVSSLLGSSAENLHPLAPDSIWLESRRFAIGSSRDEIEAWLKEIGLDI